MRGGRREKCALLDTNGLDLDESGGVSGLEPTELVHGGLLLVVQTLVRRTALDDDAALVQLQPNLPVHSPLRRGNSTSDELPLRGEEVAVVQDFGQLDGEELVPQRPDVPVERQALKVDVGGTEDGGSGSLVTSTRLDTDEPVLDDINAADSVLPAESVEDVEHLHGVGVGLGVDGGGELGGETGFELDDDALGLGGCVLGRGGQFPHVGGGSGVGVLEDTGLVGDVVEVLVGGPRLGLGLGDGDTGGLGVVEEGLTAGESVVEDCITR